MTAIKEAASEFLSQRRVAATGVSRSTENHGSNVVYKRLRERGYQVVRSEPERRRSGERSAHTTISLDPSGVDAVVIGTRAESADATMRECAELGIEHVWMHRGPGAGSCPRPPPSTAVNADIRVIDGGCPCMFGPTADLATRRCVHVHPERQRPDGGLTTSGGTS